MTTPALPCLKTAILALGLILTTATAGARLDVETPRGEMPRGKTVTAEALWESLNAELPANVWVSPLENKEYEVISAKWMTKQFLPQLSRIMDDFRASHLPEDDTAGNCNGLGLVGKLLIELSAIEVHAKAPAAASVIVKQQFAFGGVDATKVGHYVLLVLTDEGWWVIEAQSGKHVPLHDYPNRATIHQVSIH